MLDDADQAYIDTLIPSEGRVTTLCTLVAWIDPETGQSHWKLHLDSDDTTATTLGLLEMAKDKLLTETRNQR